MKQNLKVILTASAVSVLVFSAMAENTTINPANPSDRSLTNNADNAVRNARDRDNWGNATDRTLTNNADNSGRNVRDRDNRTATPGDQGNSKSDIATTAQIRKEITAEKNMSVNARNVKIITNDGKVILRGPVNNAEEKRLIGEIANRAVQAGNVDNQLEVKVTTSSAD